MEQQLILYYDKNRRLVSLRRGQHRQAFTLQVAD
jgi:hypothetical protein